MYQPEGSVYIYRPWWRHRLGGRHNSYSLPCSVPRAKGPARGGCGGRGRSEKGAGGWCRPHIRARQWHGCVRTCCCRCLLSPDSLVLFFLPSRSLLRALYVCVCLCACPCVSSRVSTFQFVCMSLSSNLDGGDESSKSQRRAKPLKDVRTQLEE